MRINMDQNMNTTVSFNQAEPIYLAMAEEAYMGEEYIEEGYMGEESMGTTVKEPLLSSWPAVIGISCGAIILGLAIGILLGRKKIKKGIELYEDN